MFDVDRSLPTGELQAGSYLLAGPAMSGKYELLLDFVEEGVAQGDAILFVTTNESAGPILDDLEERLGTLPDQLRVVDCVAERQGTEGRYPPERVEYVSSPGDLTGIGIGVSEQLRRFAASEAERTRICFYSLSTLLMYAELETVFRFLHVLSGRVDSIGALGLFALDPTTHEESTVNTLKQLFDGLVEVKDEGESQARLLGVPGGDGEWVPRA
ncbi:MAG: recombinase RecA [Halobacteriales archaeon]|nr:recombinase RecA [Halobacteriales archaeon]